MLLYLLPQQIDSLHSKKPGSPTQEGLKPRGHNCTVIIARGLVTQWTNVTGYMVIPADLQIEEEENINFHKQKSI